MLIGATGSFAEQREKLGLGPVAGGTGATLQAGSDGCIVAARPWGVAGLDAEERIASQASTGSWLALSGHVWRDLASGIDRPLEKAAGALLARLDAKGIPALAEIEGAFALCWFDGRRQRLHLVRDRFGVEPLFYGIGPGGALFGSRTRDLVATGLLPGGLCPQGLAEFLTYGFLPGDFTLDAQIRRVAPGHVIVLDTAGNVLERSRWYPLSFSGPREHDERAVVERFRALLEHAVVRRLEGSRPSALLSASLGSRSVLALACRHRAGSILSLGFHGVGPGVDESGDAWALSDALGASHTEIAYGEEQALEIEDAVVAMDAPFSEPGIDVGTWLLGRAGEGRTDFALTGDGHHAFWATDPVYATQRAVASYERLPLPRPLERGLRWLGAQLGDSDGARGLRVRARRLLPHPDLPRALGAFRWRCAYVPQELLGLVTSETARELAPANPFKSVLDACEGYDGPDDGLSRHLYAEYGTSAATSRLLLLRRFGIEARSPFFDAELVEYGTRIPASMKLDGRRRAGRLFRDAMTGVLPGALDARTHARADDRVPIKRWLRGDGSLSTRVAKVLSPHALRTRGLFRPEPVQRLLEEHRARRHDHTARIWALYVLELWLRAREGTRDAVR